MKVYFLGAGASVPAGAPLTNGILPCALARRPLEGERVAHDSLRIVREFIADFFGADVREASLTEEQLTERLPPLGDVLTTLDQFRLNGEAFGSRYPLATIERVRRCVEYGIYRGLRVAMTTATSEKLRRNLVDQKFALKIRRDVQNPDNEPTPMGVKVALITTNYDTLTMYALQPWLLDGLVDFGTAFVNYPQKGGPEQQQLRAPIALLKLHGSVDWMYCACCRQLTLGTELKVATFKYDILYSYAATSNDVQVPEEQVPRCERDNTLLEPLLITPTLLKQYDNPHVAAVYRQAWNLLRFASSVTFIGYSLPPEDYHLIHLLKRTLAQPLRSGGIQRTMVEVIGVDPGPERVGETEHRYRCLFGDVTYRGIGFEGFVTT